MTRTVNFTIVGEEKIHCEGCSLRMGKRIAATPGHPGCEGEPAKPAGGRKDQSAQVTPEQVQAKLEELGYEVTPQANSK